MKIHEYQAKELLRQYGVPTPEGHVAFSAEEAVTKAKLLGNENTGPLSPTAADVTTRQVWVVKAQIHAGGRGKGGGVKLARTLDEVRTLSESILGMQLVTHQTGAEGQTVRRLYIESGVEIETEFYFSLVFDRETNSIVVMASSEGGMEIEEVAATHPEKILKVHVDPRYGLSPYQIRKVAFGLGLQGGALKSAHKLMDGCYRCFVEKDCSLLEINPLVLTKQNTVIALDAKINFDDNALFRHADVQALRDLDEENPLEIEASKHDLSYINLDGTIGNLVNGAGLAMSTMDIIKFYGGEPANFLDVGGSASVEKVTAAFKIILADNVEAILVNIFGGIMKCDTIAEGVVAAAREVGLSVPLIVRLEGTNVELGRKILAESGLPITAASSLADAAQKAVAAVRG